MLDKSIQNGREHRKPYYQYCCTVDMSCRNHGGKTKKRSFRQCTWCLGNRLYSSTKEKERCKFEEKNYEY